MCLNMATLNIKGCKNGVMLLTAINFDLLKLLHMNIKKVANTAQKNELLLMLEPSPKLLKNPKSTRYLFFNTQSMLCVCVRTKSFLAHGSKSFHNYYKRYLSFMVLGNQSAHRIGT